MDVLIEITYERHETDFMNDTTGCAALREFAKDAANWPDYIGVPWARSCEHGHEHIYLNIDRYDIDEWLERLNEMIEGDCESEFFHSGAIVEGVNVLRLLEIGGTVPTMEDEEDD